MPRRPEIIQADLQWSAWLPERDHWERFAPGAWDRMERSFEGDAAPVILSNAASVVHRGARVTVESGAVRGCLYVWWPRPTEVARTLRLIDEDGDWDAPEWLLRDVSREEVNAEAEAAFTDLLSYSSAALEPGVDLELECAEEDFAEAMRRLSDEEDVLLHRVDLTLAGLKRQYV